MKSTMQFIHTLGCTKGRTWAFGWRSWRFSVATTENDHC